MKKISQNFKMEGTFQLSPEAKITEKGFWKWIEEKEQKMNDMYVMVI